MNWVAGILGGILAYRLFKRWQSPGPATAPAPAPAPPPPPQAPDDRAEELRTKLAESRASDEPSPVEPDEPRESPESPESPESLEERRRHVHEQGRSAIDEMQGDTEMQGGDEKP